MGIFIKGGEYWIDYRDHERRRHREKIGPSRKLAKDVLLKRQAEIAEDKFFPHRRRESLTFQQMSEKFWMLHGQLLRSKSWACMLKKLNARLGQRRLQEVTLVVLQELYNDLRKTRSTGTANRYLTLVRSLFSKAIDWGDYHGENPASRLKHARETANRLRFLTGDEIERLLRVADARIRPLLVCALKTGMRKGELLALTWENVALDQATIYILESKSGKPREVPISPALDSTLRASVGHRKGPVFDVPHITLRRLFAKALKEAAIEEFRFHDLRHTFASHFIMATGDLPSLQKILGHASPTMTQRYAHLAKGHLAAKMEQFDTLIPMPLPATPSTSAVLIEFTSPRPKNH